MSKDLQFLYWIRGNETVAVVVGTSDRLDKLLAGADEDPKQDSTTIYNLPAPKATGGDSFSVSAIHPANLGQSRVAELLLQAMPYNEEEREYILLRLFYLNTCDPVIESESELN